MMINQIKGHFFIFIMVTMATHIHELIKFILSL